MSQQPWSRKEAQMEYMRSLKGLIKQYEQDSAKKGIQCSTAVSSQMEVVFQPKIVSGLSVRNLMNLMFYIIWYYEELYLSHDEIPFVRPKYNGKPKANQSQCESEGESEGESAGESPGEANDASNDELEGQTNAKDSKEKPLI